MLAQMILLFLLAPWLSQGEGLSSDRGASLPDPAATKQAGTIRIDGEPATQEHLRAIQAEGADHHYLLTPASEAANERLVFTSEPSLRRYMREAGLLELPAESELQAGAGAEATGTAAGYVRFYKRKNYRTQIVFLRSGQWISRLGRGVNDEISSIDATHSRGWTCCWEHSCFGGRRLWIAPGARYRNLKKSPSRGWWNDRISCLRVY